MQNTKVHARSNYVSSPKLDNTAGEMGALTPNLGLQSLEFFSRGFFYWLEESYERRARRKSP